MNLRKFILSLSVCAIMSSNAFALQKIKVSQIDNFVDYVQNKADTNKKWYVSS